MAYGIIKIDTITFTDGGIDKSVAISGLVQNPTFTGNVTVTGTISGNTVRGQTVSGVTITGTTAQFASGTFTSLTGVTVTGTTASFTSGNFINISGGTHTITSGVFASGTAVNPSISFVSDPNSGLYSPGADQVAISTNGTGRLFVDASGNVGIGSAASATAARAIDINGGAVQPTLFLRASSATSATTSYTLDPSTSLVTFTSSDWPIRYFINGSERMRLDASGRLGLGTSAPTYTLDVVGFGPQSIRVASADGDLAVLRMLSNGNNEWSLASDTVMRFRKDSTEYMRLDSSGRLGIGTGSPGTTLEVNGTISQTSQGTSSAQYWAVNSGGTFYYAIDNSTGSSFGAAYAAALWHSGNRPMLFATNNSEKMRLDASGRLGLGTSDPVGLLDVRGEIKAGPINSINGTTLLSDTYTTGGASLGSLCIERSSGAFTLTTNIKQAENAAGYISTNTINAGKSALKLNSTGLFYATASASVVPIGNSVSLTDKFVITNEGSVGIGITSPGNALHVVGNIQVGSTSDTIYSSNFGNYSSASDLSLISGSASLLFKTGAANDERARIDTSGRLLVGTSTARSNVDFQFGSDSPRQQLEVANAGTGILVVSNYDNATNGAPAYLTLARAGSTAIGSTTIVANNNWLGEIDFSGSDGTDFTRAASIRCEVDGTPGTNDMPGRLVFSTTADGASSPTERMRIASGGRIALGGQGTPYPGATCDTYSNISGEFTHVFRQDHASGYGIGIGIDGIYLAYFYPNKDLSGGPVGSISQDGSATSYNTTSDYRLKENVAPLTGAINRLNQLQVRRFNFIANPGKTVDGFIAHEVQAVVPECVTGAKDEVDDDGNPVYQGIDQSKIVPLLTAALQEALAEIESLKARLDAAGI